MPISSAILDATVHSHLRLRLVKILLALSMLAIIPSLPIYFLACDFGRWFCMSFTTLVLLGMSPCLYLLLNVALIPVSRQLSALDKLLPRICLSKGNALLFLVTPFLLLPHTARPPLLLFFSKKYLLQLF